MVVSKVILVEPKHIEAIHILPDNNWSANYQILPGKEKVVAELKKLASEADEIFLATDLDREGEAIAWHLAETLDLQNKETKRIVFHEITKSAITKAVENPREIDYNLVNAQQARRVLDRLVGFELSPILWRKVKQGLSAGRVQSVAVRLLVEREREINSFESKVYYKVVGQFINKEGRSFKAEVNSRLDTLEEAQGFLQKCIDARFSIANLEKLYFGMTLKKQHIKSTIFSYYKYILLKIIQK